MNGKLYIVSTPIGNLEDITLRAVNILNNSDIIACEDTRTTKKLLNHLQIKNTLMSFHEHNEKSASAKIINSLKEGMNVSLVSDSGTPLISDPGYNLIQSCIENAIDIVPVPGPCAVITALTASGLSANEFLFLGFIPRSSKKITELFTNIKEFPYTVIAYESPKRILKSLGIINEFMGNRKIVLARELTKLHEEFLRGTISDVIKELESRTSIRGEITVLFEGIRNTGTTQDSVDVTLRKLKDEGKTLRESVHISATLLNSSKSKIYKRALKIWDKN